MKLHGVELVRVVIPFAREIGTAAGVHRTRTLLFVRVVTPEAEGWGECAALDEGTAVDPPLSDVETAIAARGVPRLVNAAAARGGHLPAETGIAQLFGSSPVDRMMGALFEMAVADAELRLSGRSLRQALEVEDGYATLPVGAAVGIPPGHDLGLLEAQVAQAVADGAARLRLKIEPGWDLEPVAAVRARHPELVLQVDANGSYAMDDAARVGVLADYDVLCVEQPLPPADLVALAEFARRIPVAVCLDESLSSPRRVRDALRNEACRIACLKPGRLGGMRATRFAHAACADAGVPVFVGGFFEAGLGRAANLALAARLAQSAPGLVSDVSAPSSYLETDPCGYPEVHAGWVRVPDGPGVGGSPEEGLRRGLHAQRRWFRAT